MTERIALVTGAGRGLGSEIARGLAADGWTVAVNDLTDEAAAAAADSIVAGGGRATPFAADVTDEAAVIDLVERISAKLGPVTAVVAGMKAAGTGRIIHIGSDLFERGEFGWSAYMAGKGAMLGLTRGWARELGEYGITVNLIAPGWIPVERHGTLPPEAQAHWLDQQAIQRMGTPADVAAAVVFLASDKAAFVTGERIAVNGGQYFG